MRLLPSIVRLFFFQRKNRSIDSLMQHHLKKNQIMIKYLTKCGSKLVSNYSIPVIDYWPIVALLPCNRNRLSSPVWEADSGNYA